MTDAQAVYATTRHGRIHRASLVGGRVLTDESCNLDDAEGELAVSDDLPESASPDTCCDRCFPDVVEP